MRSEHIRLPMKLSIYNGRPLWYFLLGLLSCALYGNVQAVEILDFEIRSPQDKPFIAHVNLKLSEAEWAAPEGVKVTLQSTTLPDYSAQVRTRLFLQPSARLAFLRISALEPLSQDMGFTIQAQDVTGSKSKLFLVSGQTVRTRDLKPLEAPAAKPVQIDSAPPAQKATANDSVPDRRVPLADAAPDQMEVRLLDQTGKKAAGRSTQSDLELLAKADQALNDNPEDKKRALDAIDSLKQIWAKSTGLWGLKAGPDRVASASVAPNAKPEPPPLTTLTLNSEGQLQQGRAVAEPPQTQNEPQKPVQEQLQEPQRSQQEVPVQSPAAAPQSGSEQSQEESSPLGNLAALAFGAAGLLFMVWVVWMRRKALGVGWQGLLHWSARLKADAARSRIPPLGAGDSGQTTLNAPWDNSLAQATQEAAPRTHDSLLNDDSPAAAPREYQEFEEDDLDVPTPVPELDLLRAGRTDTEVKKPSSQPQPRGLDQDVDVPGAGYAEDDNWFEASAQDFQIEPEFKTENDTRIEMALAFLDIEDYEAALHVVEQMAGRLTVEQQERLDFIRQSVLQGVNSNDE